MRRDSPDHRGMPTVRCAVSADAPAIALVHVEAWREAYAGIVPQAVLDGLSLEKRLALWTGILARDPPLPGEATWVAVDGGVVTGFSMSGPARDADADGAGELRAIYVRSAHWDTGTGRALHDATLGSLRAHGFRTALLWVLRDNARACRFYGRRGWRADGTTKREPVGGTELDHVRYRIDLAPGDPRGA